MNIVWRRGNVRWKNFISTDVIVILLVGLIIYSQKQKQRLNMKLGHVFLSGTSEFPPGCL